MFWYFIGFILRNFWEIGGDTEEPIRERLSWHFKIGFTVMKNKNDRYIFTLKNILCLRRLLPWKKNGEYFYDENPTVICVVQKSILSDLICVSMALGNENATTGSKMLFYAILLYVLYICRTWIHQN